MRSDYAYAKFQGINGEEFFVKKIPSKLCQSKNTFDKPFLESFLYTNSTTPENDIDFIYLYKCASQKKDYALLFFDKKISKLALISFIPIYINEKSSNYLENSDKFLSSFLKNKEIASIYDDYKLYLDSDLKIYFPCSNCDCPHVFFFFLPSTPADNTFSDQFNPTHNLNCFSPSKNLLNPMNKVPDRSLTSRWSLDDREQLKKHLLVHGYGRWKKIQESSKSVGGKLSEKTDSELRAFSNSFVRAIADNLGPESSELKNFLLNSLEESNEDSYIAPNAKDWDLSSLKQRAVPWGKRIQLMHRIKILINKFKEEAFKNIPDKDKNKINWDNMLNFLPDSMLYGQKPQVWWTKKHDIDLLRGIYKYGYANYQAIRHADEFCFKDLEKTVSYQDFPSSDTITRRLKKLIQAVIKNHQNKGKITFDMSSSEDDVDGWSIEAKQSLFKFIANYGIPLSSEGRPNLVEFKEKFIKESQIDSQEINRSVNQIEKMVQKIRIKCQQIITTDKNTNNMDEETKLNEDLIDDDFKISYEDALKFSKNENILHFIRKSILHNNNNLFKQGIEELKQKNSELNINHNAYFGPDYQCEIHDLGLLLCVIENGINCASVLRSNPFYGCEKLDLDDKRIAHRLEFLCEFYKSFSERGQTCKKRKAERALKEPNDLNKKKSKFIINRDREGNILFPIHINNSLTLLNTGIINTNPNYHSEHNLFPMGYASIRVYNSMKRKGIKCEYTNEILEGKEGKPLYRVTSSEDPDNPIIRESSTGCWVYICSRVNELQDVKKEKVTISGTERFGLLDQNIIRLLEDLPNAEKCGKYNFKYKNMNRNNEMMEEFE